jgi:hypothetical protein
VTTLVDYSIMAARMETISPRSVGHGGIFRFSKASLPGNGSEIGCSESKPNNNTDLTGAALSTLYGPSLSMDTLLWARLGCCITRLG